MTSLSKEKINKSLEEIYLKDNKKIIKWLDEIKKTENQKDGKIPGLFMKSLTKIKIDGEVYDLILQWIKDNRDKFADYDFTGVPDSIFISLSSANINTNTFETIEDIERWCKNPEIHPIKGTQIPIMGKEYYYIYESAYKILVNSNKYNINKDIFDKKKIHYKDDELIINVLPKNHLLFKNIDLVHYKCVKKLIPTYENLYMKNNQIIYELLMENLDNIEDKTNKIDIELEILRNRYTDNPTSSSAKNLSNIKILCDKYVNELVDSFLLTDYMSKYGYPHCLNIIKYDNKYIQGIWYIDFLESNKLADGQTILKYLMSNSKKSNAPEWIKNAINIYNHYNITFNDINKCFNPKSGIIENIEDKKLEYIKDPVDYYFEDFEKKLEEIKKPIYSQLIDISTFKAKNINTLNYLDDKNYAFFKKHKEEYDNKRRLYENELLIYEANPGGSSPQPPKKPTITLPNGKNITIAAQKDPIHLKDSVVKKFNIEYENAKPVIEEYNKIKNMSYLELAKYMGELSSSSKKRLIQHNELLKMTREEIYNDILYKDDTTDISNRCSEDIDILTNDEFKSDTYPLAKLQLIVRLKVYTPDKKKYRIECIYAPALYNYLIKCINKKEPFVNPVTNTKYTSEHIKELIKVMKIIDPSLKVPAFIKHKNDKDLKIGYDTYNKFGLNFYTIYLYRVIGDITYNIYDICTIPADIEASGEFATNSSDLTSSIMLYRIIKLFNDGRLLHKYTPPYFVLIDNNPDEYSYIKLGIHFNKYRDAENWIEDSTTGNAIDKTQMVEMFKHYAEEINNFIY